MNMSRKAAAAALAAAIAIPAEGLRQYVYVDPVGVLTACRGHTGPDVTPGRRYSLQECDAYLTDDMRKSIARVDACVPGLPVEVLASFGDADFNLGKVVACDKSKSTAARKLAVGDLIGACNELPKWNKGRVLGVLVPLPGLIKRRAQELALCLQGASL